MAFVALPFEGVFFLVVFAGAILSEEMCVGMCGEGVQEPAGLNRIGQAAVVEVNCAGQLWLVERRSGVILDIAAGLFGPIFKPTLVKTWPIVSRVINFCIVSYPSYG